eukprot:EG_transcript_26214
MTHQIGFSGQKKIDVWEVCIFQGFAEFFFLDVLCGKMPFTYASWGGDSLQPCWGGGTSSPLHGWVWLGYKEITVIAKPKAGPAELLWLWWLTIQKPPLCSAAVPDQLCSPKAVLAERSSRCRCICFFCPE